MIPKKPVPDVIREGNWFSEKIMRQQDRAPMVRLPFSAALLAAVVMALPMGPARAQFGSIFGPPRPPGDIPNHPPFPPPPLPPRDQADVPPQRTPPPAAQPRQQAPTTARRAPGIQSQPLPPPPGTAAPAQPSRQPAQRPPPAAPPGQPQPGNPPQPAAVTPQPDDVTVSEPPSEKIANKRAVFSGLDKITGRIISFDVAINETVQFGALQVTPRVCYTRPPTETSNTDAFVQVDEVTLQGEVRRIFSGWMFASSPGLNAVEHPIYDVWLADCKDPEKTPVAQADNPPEPQTPKPPPRRQRRSTRAPQR
jgi:hypothetical protein